MKEPHGLIKKVTEVWDMDELEGDDSSSSFQAGYAEEKDETHLRDYWRAIRKYQLMIFGITLLVTVLAVVYVARQPDIYEAKGRVQVDLENNPALGGSKGSSVIVSTPVYDPAYFNTQLEILTGSELLRRVAKTLDLEHNQTFRRPQSASSRSTTWQKVLQMIGVRKRVNENEKADAQEEVLVARSLAPATPVDDLAEAKRLAPYVRALQGGLKVEAVKKDSQAYKETRLIDISFKHNDPQMAAKIVNAVTNTFVLSNLERKTQTNASAGDFLQTRVAELQAQIRNGEERLINYAKSNQILSLDANQNTVVERLTGLNQQLLAAENERILAESAYRASLAPGVANALAADNDQQSDGGKIVELKQRRAQLLVKNTEEWPEVKEIDQQIAVLEKHSQEARNQSSSTVIANRETAYRQALSREQTLRAAFEQQRGETLAQNEAAINYRIIQQEIDTNKTLLTGLLQRYKENDVVLAGTPNNIHVVDHALVPDSPVGPRRLFVVVLASLCSLGGAIGFAFFLVYLDDTMRSVDDVEKKLRLPALAVIPTIKGAHLFPAAIALPKRNGNGNGHMELLINANAAAPLAEAYRQLRTFVLLSTAGRPPKTLLVSSSQPNEGKTTTAVNIAVSLAQTGARVLLIDADMRRPCLHALFDLSNERGLTTILSSELKEPEALGTIQHHEASGLDVLTSGPVPPNPAELLGSEEMRRLVAIFESTYGHIVIDSPPIAPFTDSVLMSSIVDGVLLVVHGGRSSREQVVRSRKALQEVGARIFGVVLNNVTVRSNDYYYHRDYYQSYGTNGNGNGNGANGNGHHAVLERKDKGLHVS